MVRLNLLMQQCAMVREHDLHRIGIFSHSFVLPSMSVNKKVTVPVGGVDMATSQAEGRRGEIIAREVWRKQAQQRIKERTKEPSV
jgi:hypothetical protein